MLLFPSLSQPHPIPFYAIPSFGILALCLQRQRPPLVNRGNDEHATLETRGLTAVSSLFLLLRFLLVAGGAAVAGGRRRAVDDGVWIYSFQSDLQQRTVLVVCGYWVRVPEAEGSGWGRGWGLCFPNDDHSKSQIRFFRQPGFSFGGGMWLMMNRNNWRAI